jgi:hypothetical protein
VITVKRFLLIGFVMALSASAEARIPRPIAAYLDRIWQCAGTPPAYVSYRKHLACDRLSADKARLEVRYRNQPKALAELNGHWVKVVKRIPVRLSAK